MTRCTTKDCPNHSWFSGLCFECRERELHRVLCKPGDDRQGRNTKMSEYRGLWIDKSAKTPDK